MSPGELNELVESMRRGRLSDRQEEQLRVFLALHPESRPEIEEELRLTEALSRLPDAPLSTNFTARVLASVNPGQDYAPKASWPSMLVRGWIPRFALAAVLLGGGLLSYQHHKQVQLQAQLELLRNLAEVQRLMSQESVDLLKNFDAIQRLGQVPADADRALIAALQ